ncbi:uncharacterized protein YqhQ [Clostridium acetobutylicum]|uniref:Uncharacterized conserved protein, predicted metal-dependent enzyme, YQHQ B.subtilis ortholog n=1 Tax=Clostridium acetobutylicum (strain ATCC 824 / DSM 792 / JCM 1419 / IAM 19013 / LMG 5710 / NBRC 13948 / NRRL B-527 / VKM B-1787 / 2291 / W) TaxID=272562 RepID=Q97F66_CLOAB|nr:MULTISPECIES: DUF1385 domain-containing protein [Clostridium]AAK80829.1 Uncharacterized conserved protein, predicted metal-dependent enzyme, YQHQ B.subtilis ortholog [Clostridium acetobutylicum ATCC 824]ADZ21930.1 Conserved hypothetical protein [Clostridium acetobutylicum EA 2018]AEI33613.1 hypothetical protein SMB_G2922 [Clostridium acetobutylicum DSM 1731]AWV78759.1 DUF1385 domain-containing protein [Clostridium acetobutylicum]MBC2393623.1 DUF1385 domain-containing protein [Clostridium ac
MSKKGTVGGQAVIEGVMMRGAKGIATAVRTLDGSIKVEFKDVIPYTKRNKFFGLPIVRGFVSLIESLVVGINTLNYSASFCEEGDEDEKPSNFDKWIEKILGDKANDLLIVFSLMVSLVFAVAVFFILPTFLANLFSRFSNNSVILNFFEGVIRVFIFIMYIFIIGKMGDIQRVFQYHGAEHKTVFCYEKEDELTPSKASKYSRFHPRCGTNFLFLVMIVSIIVFSFAKWNSLPERIIWRIILLPLVSGITYEIIKWMGKSESKVSKILSYPGLMLQRLTTREPSEDQLEVAIKALRVAEGIDYDEEEKSIEETDAQ